MHRSDDPPGSPSAIVLPEDSVKMEKMRKIQHDQSDRCSDERRVKDVDLAFSNRTRVLGEQASIDDGEQQSRVLLSAMKMAYCYAR